MKLFRSKIAVLAMILLLVCITYLLFSNKRKIDFVSEVKPIINKQCISCHGGVKQQAGFSLLFREEALAKTESGRPAIIPGNPAQSELMRRITNKDPEERMPYKHDPLSKQEIAIFRDWIKQGAEWGQHWAYASVKAVPVPKPTTFFGLISKESDWAQNEIDEFIEEKLRVEKLQPSPAANKQTLLRRASLDIIGMPAPRNLAMSFLSDNSPKAFTNLVDSLLALPQYGEKWSSFWLDIARYADTKGYERDAHRNIWAYRDWLIKAFNNDKPYDQFLTEQIAGDLLPNPSEDNYIASGFHRNTMTNDEGGTNNEEFRTAAVMDRINTTWQGLLGTTFACVQCHSHPYDPFKHEDYYKFMAFFNDSRDEDTEADYPVLRQYPDSLKKPLQEVISWVKTTAGAEKAKEINTFLRTWQPAYNSLQADSFTQSELSDTKWLALRNNAQCRLKNVFLQDKNQLLFRYQSGMAGGSWKIHTDSSNGPLIATIPIQPTTRGWEIKAVTIMPSSGIRDLYFSYTNNKLKTPEETGITFDWFYFTQPFPGEGKAGYAGMKSRYWNLLTATPPTTPIMMENPSYMHRASYVFERGNWMAKTKLVTPGLPASLNSMPANAPNNRLGLAMWLTAKENPLTARNMVNHVWEQIFGVGLAETLEDLGSQGILPTHPELLDWLSYTYMNKDQWSTKKLIRKMVLSATYQQSSVVSAELLAKDPSNHLYTRFPRVRLSAEQLRDQALCLGGLMSKKMYGPSVFPYQPEGIWLSPWNGEQWKKNDNEDQYRRAVYTFWKRSAAYPSMTAFDAVSREVCTVRRIRTNTPLQALTTLNDSVYIDIARHFAKRMQQQQPADIGKQISAGFQLATNRQIDQKSLAALTRLYHSAKETFGKDDLKTSSMLADSSGSKNKDLAALTVVANAMLNLDEVVTKN
ncbi:MAG: DUF1553 domain-containing protein [Bacteroidota bacterium]